MAADQDFINQVPSSVLLWFHLNVLKIKKKTPKIIIIDTKFKTTIEPVGYSSQESNDNQ